MSRFLVRAAPPEHYVWLARQSGCTLTPGFRAIEAVDSHGAIRGMVGYCDWTANAVRAHMAVDSPIVWRALVRPAFEYPFLEAGKGVVLGFVDGGNARSVRLTRRLGFREAYRIRDACAVGRDLVVFEMRREDCMWLPEPLRKAA